jgi:hypothetical protein
LAFSEAEGLDFALSGWFGQLVSQSLQAARVIDMGHGRRAGRIMARAWLQVRQGEDVLHGIDVEAVCYGS